MTHYIDLDTVVLAKGGHEIRSDGVCLLEAVAWWAQQVHTDHPPCVSPVLGVFGRNFNDVLPDGKRQALRPLIPLLPGTASDGLDETRSYLALDWLIRTWAPAWLDLTGLAGEATALRGLPRIADLDAAREAGRAVHQAQAMAATAGGLAGEAAWAAAWAQTGAAALAAAKVAAVRAALEAGVPARAAAEAAVLPVAGAAAVRAGAAAWVAADKRLAPTVVQLQDSAMALFPAMIKPAMSDDAPHFR